MIFHDTLQENKTELLEYAVLNQTPEQLAETVRGLGHIDMTARALGLACRFRGVETVRTLTECGANFDIPQDEDIERLYHCYSGMKFDNYRSDFSLYLLKTFRQIKGACCCKGLKLAKRAETDNKKYLLFLPDNERLKVLRYLCENKDRLLFNPSEMLFYAIFARDTVIVEELKSLGIGLSEKRLKRLTEGGMASDSYWYEWCAMMGKLSDEDYIPVMKMIAAELGGKPLYCTGKVYDTVKKRFADKEIFDFFSNNFRTDKLNKTKIIRDLIDCNSVGMLPEIEKLGWLGNPKRRDELIEYAQKENKTECTAWLLDFKNRTADLVSEQKRAEKRMMTELNASPDSVLIMKKTWSFKKREDGTLIITGYKGNRTEIAVPEKIGKNVVSAIGEYAFSMNAPQLTDERALNRSRITKVIVPPTVRTIGEFAFGGTRWITGHYNVVSMLEEVILPGSLEIFADKESAENAPIIFDKCPKLTVKIPHSPYAEIFCRKNKVNYAFTEDKNS